MDWKKGSISRSAHSSEVTTVDFCIGSHVKSLVYKTPVNTDEKVVARIVLAFDDIRERRQLFQRFAE